MLLASEAELRYVYSFLLLLRVSGKRSGGRVRERFERGREREREGERRKERGRERKRAGEIEMERETLVT